MVLTTQNNRKKIAVTKENFRKIFRDKRLALEPEEVLQKSRQINHNFINNLLPQLYQKNSVAVFSLYFASAGEVETDLVAQHFKKNYIKFSYPKIVQKNHHLDFILHEENQELAANSFYPKILEIAKGEKVLPDILILPLVAFDQDLSRLGMGGGFFDRTIKYLKNHKSEIVTIGLAYDFQRSEQVLPIEKTDQRLDFIVTEKSIFVAS